MLSVPKRLTDSIAHYAKFPQTGVSLRQMVEFGQNPNQGTLLKAAQFLHDELPIRLAHRVVELDNLPNNLDKMPSIQRVKRWYIESFNDLVNFPRVPEKMLQYIRIDEEHRNATLQKIPEAKPNHSLSTPEAIRTPNSLPSLSKRYHFKTLSTDFPPEFSEYNKRFVNCIEHIKRRHDSVVSTVAQGINEYKKHIGVNLIDDRAQMFLDRFYLSRIGIRMLIGQQIALNLPKSPPGFVGVIQTNIKLDEVVQEAIDNATFVCEDHYMLLTTPKVTLQCPDNIHFTYVPSHLHHMVFELLKNSLRAVVETYGDEADDYPEIKVVISEGSEDITIKITDEGGGIPRSEIDKVWTYMYTTADAPSVEDSLYKSDFKAPLAGFGYGLPLSRLYARYFGGDLRLVSMEGRGTDAYLHLSRLSNSEEPLA
ncbi:[Pyruvate dehydrogenase (acetyl-transferring)] kinase isozyme 2 [Mycoemilia scoparia]|uniref:Protein-serine/threonine kinase n=1 Tax=Mycoemilia scoparia TaxID=417184 RepID=A0A9W8A340_9FUNG|nr:[Pyruvate dehydrogenase (acetyl-transferring)] kinase isozyme 2 [Mycoemilia scoparia]